MMQSFILWNLSVHQKADSRYKSFQKTYEIAIEFQSQRLDEQIISMSDYRNWTIPNICIHLNTGINQK